MKLPTIILGAVLSAVLAPAHAAQSVREFVPKCGIAAKVVVEDAQVAFEVTKGALRHADSVTIETEKALRVQVADYNFDGYDDFAVSHLDDGMGTYTIFHIYAYVPKTNKFVAMTPKCGDEFINVVLNKKRRALNNSYYADNVMKACTQKF